MLLKFATALILFLSLLFTSALFTKADEKQAETYHILQKGFILIEGSTNLFRFTGKSVRHSGQLEEDSSGLYTGHIVLRFDQISFQLPAVDSVLKDPKYLNTETYPTIEINLDHFDPHQQPSFVEGLLKLHGVEKKIQIQVDFLDISPIVKATGQFAINQSEFQIPPYKSGILEIDDRLNIKFQLFFCEIHHRIPDDDSLDNPLLQDILRQENITILSEPTFFGCKELKKVRKN